MSIQDQQTLHWRLVLMTLLRSLKKNDKLDEPEEVIAISEPVGKSCSYISLKRIPLKNYKMAAAPLALQNTTAVTF
jgi:hypothetical protein